MIWSRLLVDTSILDRVERRMPSRINDTLTKVAYEIIDDIDSTFYPGTPPSPVGGPPAVVTGELRDSATVEPAREADGRFTFGKVIRYNAEYAKVLETANYAPSRYEYNRPFLEAALDRATGRFAIVWEGIFRA